MSQAPARRDLAPLRILVGAVVGGLAGIGLAFAAALMFVEPGMLGVRFSIDAYVATGCVVGAVAGALLAIRRARGTQAETPVEPPTGVAMRLVQTIVAAGLGGLAGLGLAFSVVYLWIDWDMVGALYVLGIAIGAVAGLMWSVVRQRRRRSQRP